MVSAASAWPIRASDGDPAGLARGLWRSSRCRTLALRTWWQEHLPHEFVWRSGVLHSFSPQVQLETQYRLDAQGQIISTREPRASRGPRFSLIRSTTQVAWAVRSGTPPGVVDTLAALVADEPPLGVVGDEPRHAAEYLTAVDGSIVSGPAFVFPQPVGEPHRAQHDVVLVEDLATISRQFSGWSHHEIPTRQPIFGILESGDAVSLCFCARRAAIAAEAGIETARPYRGRGLAARVAVAWAAAVQAEGLVPIYSTQWTNSASLAVARKLGLEVVADDWDLVDP